MPGPRTHKDYSKIKKDIVSLLQDSGVSTADNQIYEEMLINIGQLREEKLDVVELRLLNTAFKELRYAMKVFKPYRDVPKAAVFGSARTPGTHADFKFAERFGKKLAKKGWMIITGGASGIMEAAMIGAGAKNSFGLNIMLPFEQYANSVIRDNEKLIYFKYFFTRKLMFLKESAATVLFPGGFGTFDEGFESFTLVQTGKAKPRPLVLMDTPGSDFWSSLLKLLNKNMGGQKLISPGDLDLMLHTQDCDEAVEEVTGFYKNYHSSRFFRDKYLIRLNRLVSADALARINKEFKGLLTTGEFELLSDLSLEDNKEDGLTRLIFSFNKTNYQGLRKLINYLNKL